MKIEVTMNVAFELNLQNHQRLFQLTLVKTSLMKACQLKSYAVLLLEMNL